VPPAPCNVAPCMRSHRLRLAVATQCTKSDVMFAVATTTHLDASEQDVMDADVRGWHRHEAVDEQLAVIAQARRDLRSDVTADGVDCCPCSPAACRPTCTLR